MDPDLHADVKRWREWINGPIREDMIGMHHRRFIWRRVTEIANTNPEVRDKGSAFWDFLGQTYAATQAIAIRRQAMDTRRDVSSLALVIKQMRGNAQALTRDSYVSLFDENDELMFQRAHEGFNRLADKSGAHLDPDIPTADLDALKDAAKRVGIYANEQIAHAAAEPTVPEMPTYDDLNAAMDALGRICQKYTVWLTAGWPATWEPVMQHDWEAIFRVAWLPPKPT
ncbi:MAG TPA: hypothetical protein VNY27_03455 [Solirubrobacteraceae bacterium]|nr:hypothetical protein [Solirubrobacteraceae bacterium]